MSLLIRSSWTNEHEQKAVGSVERDENYVPRTRSDCGLPPESVAHATDYHDIFEETPIYTLARMVLMQLFGLHSYLLFNTLGSPMYPEGTNVSAFTRPSMLQRSLQSLFA